MIARFEGGANAAIQQSTVVIADVLRAWRALTVRQWVWTSGIALVLILAYWVGILPSLLSAVAPTPNGAGSTGPAWTSSQSVGLVLGGLIAAYCFLLALSVAEHDRVSQRKRAWRYFVAGCAATGAAVAIECAMYLLMPGLAPKTGGWTNEPRRVIGFALWSAANFGLTGGLVLAVYARLQAARSARTAFNSAELERAGAAREVLQSRLAAMQAEIEPKFLLGTLAQVEALYARDPPAGDRMLDGLIAYLRAALPQMRSSRSTLSQELQLAASYLRIVQLRMGSRLAYEINARPGVGERRFPPMLLLPLIDHALRSGLEPLPAGGTITIGAEADERFLRVTVADDGLPRDMDRGEGIDLRLMRERLSGLCGHSARLVVARKPQHGVVVTIEVPLETARDHR